MVKVLVGVVKVLVIVEICMFLIWVMDFVCI